MTESNTESRRLWLLLQIFTFILWIIEATMIRAVQVIYILLKSVVEDHYILMRDPLAKVISEDNILVRIVIDRMVEVRLKRTVIENKEVNNRWKLHI